MPENNRKFKKMELESIKTCQTLWTSTFQY